MDTGVCHAKGAAKRYMYKAADPAVGPAADIMHTPVHVWDASGGTPQELTTQEFNRLYVVDYRFDTSRVPEGSGR